MKFRNLLSLTSVVAVLLSATFAAADMINLFDGTGAPVGGAPASMGPINMGREFTVTDPISVTDLGVFDFGEDGLSRSHTVTLFDIGGVGSWGATELASVEVPAGGDALLADSFRYMPITPLLLNPGTYSVVAYGMQTGDYDTKTDPYGEPNGTAPITPGVDVNISPYGDGPVSIFNWTTDASPAFPYNNFANGTNLSTASFRYTTVPEPSTIVLLLTCGLAALFVARRNGSVK